MKKLCVIGTLITLVGGVAVSVNAGVYYDIGTGTAAPPPTLGGYSMVGLSGDSLTFDSSDAIAIIPGNVPADYATWSHGYSGTVYQALGATDLTLTLPTGALAFYFYIEPNSKGIYDFTVSSDPATKPTSFSLSINGDGGAAYVGFYSDNTSDPLVSITVETDPAASGFAVGEFGINGVPTVPDTASCLNIIAAIGSLGLAGWRCRRS